VNLTTLVPRLKMSDNIPTRPSVSLWQACGEIYRKIFFLLRF